MDPSVWTCSSAAPWLPRAGGDGPTTCGPRVDSRSAPPRRRGWTRHAPPRLPRPSGSPAQAGMDPLRPHHRGGVTGLPRAGGDGPGPRPRDPGWGGAPPRRRGWTLARGPNGLRGLGSPAQAGMDPRDGTPPRASSGLPRAGGDGPRRTRCCGTPQSAPPRRRGWTHAPAVGHPAPHGSPAQAGMDPPPPRPRDRRVGLPRAGGDGPATRYGPAAEGSAPPRRRGWTQRGGG